MSLINHSLKKNEQKLNNTIICAKSVRHVQLFATPWTVARQASLSMGILQARILEWVAMSFSRGSSQPRDQAHVPTLQADSLPSEPPGKPASLLNSWSPNKLCSEAGMFLLNVKMMVSLSRPKPSKQLTCRTKFILLSLLYQKLFLVLRV